MSYSFQDEQNIKFIFDLDGTLTKQETLPLIADYFGLESDISVLTKATLTGAISLEESLRIRVDILGKIPAAEIRTFLKNILLHTKILSFIQANHDKCVIATANLDIWIADLVKILGCTLYSSKARLGTSRIELHDVLKKEQIVLKYQNLGYKVLFAGDSHNDIPAMRMADISIAVGLTHPLTKEVLSASDYHFYDEESFYNYLVSISIKPPKYRPI